jgi:hypothetical protein
MSFADFGCAVCGIRPSVALIASDSWQVLDHEGRYCVAPDRRGNRLLVACSEGVRLAATLKLPSELPPGRCVCLLVGACVWTPASRVFIFQRLYLYPLTNAWSGREA